MTDEGVQAYIATKKAVLRNMAKIQNELSLMIVNPESFPALKRIQGILDDPFTNGLPSNT